MYKAAKVHFIQCGMWSCMLLFMCSTIFFCIYSSSSSQRRLMTNYKLNSLCPLYIFHGLFLFSYHPCLLYSSHYLITDESRAATPAHGTRQASKSRSALPLSILSFNHWTHAKGNNLWVQFLAHKCVRRRMHYAHATQNKALHCPAVRDHLKITTACARLDKFQSIHAIQ